eukprot:58662_1
MCFIVLLLLAFTLPSKSRSDSFMMAGAYHTCIYMSPNNKTKCYGYNNYGQLGLGDTNNRGGASNGMGDSLLEIDLGSDFFPMQIVAGIEHTCALSTANKVKCFGNNNNGVLGYGDTNNRG